VDGCDGVPAFAHVAYSHACQKVVDFPRKSNLSRTRHRDHGYVWSRSKCPTDDQKEPTGFRIAGTFSKFHSLPQINRGAFASGTIFCFFLRSGCIFSLDNIPRSFHLGSLNFCVVTQSIMGWICVHFAHIRSSCFLSSHELSLPGSPETRGVLPNCTMVGRHARSSHSPVGQKNIVSCTPLQRCYPNAQS